MDSAILNNRLKERASDVVLHLFPAAQIKGHIAQIGGLEGDKGKSFQVHVSGSRIGMWNDFANRDVKGGSLLWLWSKVRNLTYTEAIKEAKDYLGIKHDDYGLGRNRPKKTWALPDRKGLCMLRPSAKGMDYLILARKIDPLAIASNHISETRDGESIVFPYIDHTTGKACHIKYLKIAREVDPDTGKETKVMWASKDTKRCLFGKQTIMDSHSELLLCEGEIDKLSWESLGVPSCSIPMGVNDQEWVDIDWEWLERFETIYLSFDMDGAGNEAVERIAKRLGLHRVKVVALPHKDANKCLQEGWQPADAAQALKEAKRIEISEIQAPTSYLDEVYDIFNPRTGMEGYETPWWPKLPFRVKPGELTVLSGFSGHGKTAWINHLIVSLLSQGARVMDCSLEIKPARTLQWLARQALNKRKPASKEELEATLQWLGSGLWLFDYVGTANVPRMFEAMLYAVKRYGVNVIFIDSLFKCGVGSEDYNGQKEFTNKLTDFARDTGVHVFLVAHSRKPPALSTGPNEGRVPSKDEIAGSSDIQNNAFNILIIWRNKEKQRKLDELREKQTPDLEAWNKLEAAPDGRIKLDKSRFDGIEREMSVWFDTASTQFCTEKDARPTTYFTYAPHDAA